MVKLLLRSPLAAVASAVMVPQAVTVTALLALAALVPHVPVAVAVILPGPPAAAAAVTVIVAVPCPVKELPTVAGTVQVKEVAPADVAV